MRFLRVGRHTFRLDLIEHLWERPLGVDPARGSTLTVFLQGRASGIELTSEESVALLRFLVQEHAVSDLIAQTRPGMAPADPAADVAWYTAAGPRCRYDQGALLRPRLAAIRRLYPGSRVMVQTSEMPAETVARWKESTADLAIDWLAPLPIHTAGPRVTPIGAMLEAYLDHPRPAEFLFKVDLDARVRRRFRWLPRGSLGVFGSLEFVACSGFPYGDFPNVQGGCYGLSRETARRVLEGGLLTGPELREDPGVWVDGIADWRGFAERGIIGEDGLLRWVTKRMGIRPFAYDEIDSRFRDRPRGAGGDFAVTHPHKVLEPDEAASGAPPAPRPTPSRVQAPPDPTVENERRYFASCEGLRPEYRRVADWLAARLKPESVLDLGCGCAYVLERFQERGTRVRGVDGSRQALESSPSEVRGDLRLADLRRPLDLGRFGLVVCTGVAEFLPPEATGQLVETIAAHVGAHLFFSAETPGPGGRRLANERPHGEWIAAFEGWGLAHDPEATGAFRSAMEGSPLPGIPKDALIFRRRPASEGPP